VLGLHVPAAWQASLAVHVTGLEPTHVPLWQESLCVQAFPSLQVVPFAAAGFEHAPVLGLHAPAAWHWSLAVHTTALLPVHTPSWHESSWVHVFPSLQAVPFGAAGVEHVPLVGLQTPATWHWSAATQVTGLLPTHEPLWHESLSVQALPSLQAVPFASAGLEQTPVAGAQTPTE